MNSSDPGDPGNTPGQPMPACALPPGKGFDKNTTSLKLKVAQARMFTWLGVVVMSYPFMIHIWLTSLSSFILLRKGAKGSLQPSHFLGKTRSARIFTLECMPLA
jgi:hypothetical protein